MKTYHSLQASDVHQEVYKKYFLFAVEVYGDDCAPGPTRKGKSSTINAIET